MPRYKIRGNYIDENSNYFKEGDLIELKNESKIKRLIQGRVIFDRPEDKITEIEREVIEPEEVSEQNKYPKRTGPNSSWYELSNGEKIQGKEEAIEKQKEIDHLQKKKAGEK